MSKVYSLYTSLKDEDKEKIYLIKCGAFYISLEQDAIVLSDIFKFKITNLNEDVIKCGFPCKRLEYYTNLLEKLNLKYQVIGNIVSDKDKNLKSLLQEIIRIKTDNLDIEEAVKIIETLKEKSRIMLGEEL